VVCPVFVFSPAKTSYVHLKKNSLTYSNLLAWFMNFRAFLLEKDFAQVGGDGHAFIFDEEMLL